MQQTERSTRGLIFPTFQINSTRTLETSFWQCICVLLSSFASKTTCVNKTLDCQVPGIEINQQKGRECVTKRVTWSFDFATTSVVVCTLSTGPSFLPLWGVSKEHFRVGDTIDIEESRQCGYHCSDASICIPENTTRTLGVAHTTSASA